MCMCEPRFSWSRNDTSMGLSRSIWLCVTWPSLLVLRDRDRQAVDRERRVVDVAPAPVLARLEGEHDRVVVLGGVLAGVPVRRGVAAPDLPAREAQAQVHPAVALGDAL